MDTATSADGTTIAYDRWGSGPAVVVVGGAFGTREAGGYLARALAEKGFTGVSYDRRGRGDSSDTAPYAVERELEDLNAVVEAATSGGDAYAFGMSSGGALVLRAAAASAPLAKVAVMEPPYRVPDGPPAPAGYIERLHQAVESGDRGGAVEYFMTAAVGLPPEAVAGMRQSPEWPQLEALAHTLAYDGEVMGTGDQALPEDVLGAVKVPVLTISSTESPAWLVSAAEAAAAAVGDGRHRQFEGAFHEVPVATLAPALEEFFRS